MALSGLYRAGDFADKPETIFEAHCLPPLSLLRFVNNVGLMLMTYRL